MLSGGIWFIVSMQSPWWMVGKSAFFLACARPATVVVVAGLSGVWSGGECSGLPVDSVLDEGQVVGFHFDADGVESFDECRLDGGARSGERVKHSATRRSHETDQPSHDREGLHS